MSAEGFDAGRFEFRVTAELIDSLGRAHAEISMLKVRVEEQAEEFRKLYNRVQELEQWLRGRGWGTDVGLLNG